MPKYFVWMQGLRGLEAQLWSEEPVDGNGKQVKTALFKQKLSPAEETLSLDYLVMKFERNKPNAML